MFLTQVPAAQPPLSLRPPWDDPIPLQVSLFYLILSHSIPFHIQVGYFAEPSLFWSSPARVFEIPELKSAPAVLVGTKKFQL